MGDNSLHHPCDARVFATLWHDRPLEEYLSRIRKLVILKMAMSRAIDQRAPRRTLFFDFAALFHHTSMNAARRRIVAYYGVFGTHWATLIFVPPSRQNRSIRPPTGKYQWASGRIFCTPSSPVHMTFTSNRTCQNRLFFNIITNGQFIFLHCYFVCRKIDASSITIRQLKTAPARAFIFSGNVVGFQRATYASQCK